MEEEKNMSNHPEAHIPEKTSEPASADEQSGNKEESKVSIAKEILDWVLHIAAAIAIALLIVKFVAQVTVVIGSSMEPTLHDHNKLMMEKITPRFGNLDRGDIIVLEAEQELIAHENRGDRSPLIKRIIGIAGDHIQISAGKLRLNGTLKSEDYILGNATYAAIPIDVTVPPDHIFVMGDNRPRGGSIDSRILGTFHKSKVIGRVMFRMLPLDEFGTLKK